MSTVAAGSAVCYFVSAVAETIASDYAAKLLKIAVAAARFDLNAKTFMRLRRRHGIRTMPGNKVHVDDVISALEKERRG